MRLAARSEFINAGPNTDVLIGHEPGRDDFNCGSFLEFGDEGLELVHGVGVECHFSRMRASVSTELGRKGMLD